MLLVPQPKREQLTATELEDGGHEESNSGGLYREPSKQDIRARGSGWPFPVRPGADRCTGHLYQDRYNITSDEDWRDPPNWNQKDALLR